MAVLVIYRRSHAELGGADSAPLDLFERQLGAVRNGIQNVQQRGLIRAGIGQRAHQHISTDARKGVQVTDLHGVSGNIHYPIWLALPAIILYGEKFTSMPAKTPI